MKKLIIVFILLNNCLTSKAQTLLDSTTYFQTLQTTRNEVNNQIKDTTRLVSEYTFRNLVRNDFSVLLTGDKNKTTLGRYASLEINEDEKQVNLTPLAIIPGNNSIQAPFHWVHSVDLKASINSKKIFDFEDRKKFSAGYSLTYVSAGYKFYEPSSTEPNRKPDTSIYIRLHNNIYTDFINKYNNLSTVKDTLDILEYASDTTELKRAFLEKVKDYENKLTKDKWNLKHFWWIKGNFNFLSWDNFELLGMDDSTSFNNTKSNSIYNPSIQLSGNVYFASRNFGNLYLNAWIRGSIKHNLSEVATTNEWNKIKSYSDSIYTVDESKDVYILSSTKVETKILPDFGGQVIYLIPNKGWFEKFAPGIDFSMSWNGIISPTVDKPIGFVNETLLGIVLPLKDKEGENTINVEPFLQYKNFINYPKTSKRIWGVRFSLPFNKLF